MRKPEDTGAALKSSNRRSTPPKIMSRMIAPHRCRLRPAGHDPHYAPPPRAKAFSVNQFFLDGL
jgi:hypothetical protein